MDQFERMKVTRQAMNGRMCLMFGGIFLMFSAITSTIMYGINFFMTALEADKGTAEYVELLENAGVGSGLLKGIGICFIAVGIWEAVVGFLSVRNSNRVDKSRFSVKLAISLLITEIVMQVILFFTGLMNLGLLFTAIVLPLFLLWGATRLGKISDSNIKNLRLLIPFKYEIHSSKERGIQHFTKSFSQMDLLLVGVDLVKKCLLVIEIFVTILVHLRIVLPVILMHSFDILLSFQNGLADMGDPGF